MATKKMNFRATVRQESDWFVAQCLDVDVASHGTTREEALANLKKAIELHFDEPCATEVPEVVEIQVEVYTS
jgi:predicted RNase H-like HicB family nuclease